MKAVLSTSAAVLVLLANLTLAATDPNSLFNGTSGSSDAADGGVSCNYLASCATSDARAIQKKLIGLGTEKLEVVDEVVLVASHGSCDLYGKAENAKTATSYARDVGYGLRNIINKCAAGNGKVYGEGFAGGNGDFAIGLCDHCKKV